MLINLNEFLLSISKALDYAEKEFMNVSTNHSKRCAYIAVTIGKEMGMSNFELYDLCSYALMHDSGITETFLNQDWFSTGSKEILYLTEALKEHCTIGEKYINTFPSLTKNKNIILYHHEHYDGSGFFGVKGDDIPLMSQLIAIADELDMNFDLTMMTDTEKNELLKFVKKNCGILFSPEIVNTFLKISNRVSFWSGLQDEYIMETIQGNINEIFIDIDAEGMLSMTAIFSRIVDAKSKFTAKHSSSLTEKAEIIADYLGFDDHRTLFLMIASNLHDIGKLAVPRHILEKSSSLNPDEFSIIKEHVRVTDSLLKNIQGFETIHRWAASHHERIDGSGYPYGLTNEQLDYESQLLGALDMYQALTEERPYREGLLHDEAMGIMNKQALKGIFDLHLVSTIDIAFR